MANAAALIKESIWRDRDFRKLSRGAQCTYLQLVSQKDLDCAGLLTLHISFLAKGCDEVTEAGIRHNLEELQDNRFVFFDEESDELFVRGYMRTAGVVKSPNIFKSALKSAGLVQSDGLRVEVAGELRRLNRKEAAELADELNPSETLRPDPTNPSGTRTLSEPSSLGTVTGTGESSVVGNFGEDVPPPQFCPKHPGGTPDNCWACKSYREAFQAWEARAAERKLAADERVRLTRARVLKACVDCDEDGWRYDDREIKCKHQEAM